MIEANNFTFEKLRARLPIFKNDLGLTVHSLQREDYFGLKNQINALSESEIKKLVAVADFGLEKFFSQPAYVKRVPLKYSDMHEVLGSDLVLAYRFYFSELTIADSKVLMVKLLTIDSRHQLFLGKGF